MRFFLAQIRDLKMPFAHKRTLITKRRTQSKLYHLRFNRSQLSFELENKIALKKTLNPPLEEKAACQFSEY